MRHPSAASHHCGRTRISYEDPAKDTSFLQPTSDDPELLEHVVQSNESKHWLPWVASQRTKTTATEKTKAATVSMLEKVQPVAAATAAKAKGKPLRSMTFVSSADRNRWKGKMAAGDFALLERFSPPSECGSSWWRQARVSG